MPENKSSKLTIEDVSLMNQCWHIFVEAQRVWKCYANGLSSPYDNKQGRFLLPFTMPSRWVIDSVEPHEDLMKKTLEGIYKDDFDWQLEVDRALKLFKWCSKHIFGIMDSDKKVEVAVNQARCNIFGRNSNSEKELTDEEILACFVMRKVLEAKIMFQCGRAEGIHSTLGDDKLSKAKALLELAKSGRKSEEPILAKSDINDWSINDARDIFCNGQRIATLPSLQFKLFKHLYVKRGKYVSNKNLEKYWGNVLPNYTTFLPDTMSKIGNKLKKGLADNNIHVKGRLIEPKQKDKKNVAYKLVI